MAGETHLVGRLHAAERGSSVSFEYAPEWLQRDDAFAIDPTSLPLQRGAHHGKALFGAIQDCGPDRWGRILIERAVRKKVLTQKPYRDIDYVLALDDVARVGALRFRFDAESPFLAATTGRLPPLVRLNALLRATDAIHSETETAEDLRFLLGAGSPLGGARPKAAVSLADDRLAMAKFSKPDDTRDIAAGEILALTLAARRASRLRNIGSCRSADKASPSSRDLIARAKPHSFRFRFEPAGTSPRRPGGLHVAGRRHPSIRQRCPRRPARIVASPGLFAACQQL